MMVPSYLLIWVICFFYTYFEGKMCVIDLNMVKWEFYTPIENIYIKFDKIFNKWTCKNGVGGGV